jgi:peptide/nickel transport system substrate-binding protein
VRLVAACLLAGMSACQRSEIAPAAPGAVTVAFGVGKASDGANGLPGVALNMQTESLIAVSQSGRAEPWLARKWTVTDDGLVWTVELRENAKFHDGSAVTANRLAPILARTLPNAMGGFFEDVAAIDARGPYRLEVRLKRPSAFFLESLDVSIVDPDAGRTGAYQAISSNADGIELAAFPDYWGGKPHIDRIFLRRYDSARGAWADMLRGEADMLYEVPPDAVGFVKGTSGINVFPYRRRYASEILLNTQRRPELRRADLRRRLNAAIDRRALVAEASAGQGRPQDTPVWPYHWAYRPDFPTFRYDPMPLDEPLKLTCLFPDASFEHLALAVQRQLSAIGVDLELKQISIDELNRRVDQGDFEALLSDFIHGPTASRMTSRWYTTGSRNWSHYSSPEVDAAVEALHDARDDEAFRRAFGRYERALVDDPPAIFLIWSERTRAVRERFSVPDDPTRDVMNTIRQWQVGPVALRSMTH